MQCEAIFEEGKITALYGKSGSGKSSILRMIAGLEKADSGHIKMGKEVWYDSSSKTNTKLKSRSVNMVFQEYNLFDNMTVEGNLKFASGGALSQEIMSLANRLGLIPLFGSKPPQLSGGQRQKVAVLRSICQNDKVILFDEPFSALDDESIDELLQVIKALKSDFWPVIILVTHRKDIVKRIADSVVLINEDGPSKQLSDLEML